MTLNARFILKCAKWTAHLTYMYVVAFGFDRTHRCSQRGRRGVGSWRAYRLSPPPSMWAADALFLCGSWPSCLLHYSSLHVN